MTRQVNRRTFLHATAAAGLSSLGPLRAASSEQVVIVGAGLAGLRAAQILRQAGRDVLVLEAQSSAGGRVHTTRTPFGDLYAEAGPIRIAATHATVLALVREYGLTLLPFASANGDGLATMRGDRARIPRDLQSKTWRGLRADERGTSQAALLERYVGDLPPSLADPSAEISAAWWQYDRMTWPAWLLSRGASEAATSLMTLGGESRNLSALYLLRQYALLRSVTQFYKIQEGMDRLPRTMAAALGDVIRYRASVVHVAQGPRPAVTYREEGKLRTVRAAHVILAIPFSTLRDVAIDPPLPPDKRQAIAQLPYFPVTRVLLKFRERFWHRSGLSGSARTDWPAEIWDATYDLGGNAGILAATIGGDANEAFHRADAEGCIRLGLEVVAQAFPESPEYFESGVAHRWSLERWAQGAFAVFHPGQAMAMMPALARREGALSFAGEHTAAWMGWMEGALASGERAASEAISALH